MGKYLSFHKIENKYICIILFTFIIYIFLYLYGYITYIIFKYNNKLEEIENNKNNLMFILIGVFLQSLFFIPELFIKRFSSSNNNTFKEIKYNFKFKDILTIIFVDIILLINIFIKFLFLIKTKIEILSGIESNIFYISIFFMTILLFKKNYYIHQYISIIIIILLGIIESIFNFFQEDSEDIIFNEIIIELSLYLINNIAFSFYLGYFKIFMEKYYFSPFKIFYLFGMINTLIILIILFIISYIPCEESLFCNIKYKNKYYFDNIYAYFTNNDFSIILYNFLSYLISSSYDFIFIITIHNYPFCYVFFPQKVYEFLKDLYEIFINKNIYKKYFLIITNILEFILILILIEIIELKFCGLNKNFRVNIYKRSISEISDDLDINDDRYEIEDNYYIDYDNDEKEFKNDKETQKIELKNS